MKMESETLGSCSRIKAPMTPNGHAGHLKSKFEVDGLVLWHGPPLFIAGFPFLLDPTNPPRTRHPGGGGCLSLERTLITTLFRPSNRAVQPCFSYPLLKQEKCLKRLLGL